MKKNKKYAVALICLVLFIAAFTPPKIPTASLIAGALTCEYRVAPLGIDIQTPRLAWQLSPLNNSIRGLRQTAYQILVASSPELLNKNIGDLWNSGKVISNQTTEINYAGTPLKSQQIMYWKVRVWDEKLQASQWSTTATWTTGIMEKQDWSGAKWIGASGGLDTAINGTFLLRKEFVLRTGIKRAVISICGLGQYEMTVNGKDLTETLLNPGWTQYDKTCLYDTYDITKLVNSGANAVGIMLSNGMYRVKKGGRYAKFEHSFGLLQAIAKITFQYTNGSVEMITTDENWKAGQSPMIWSSIYGGEDWDNRKVEQGWNKAGFNAPGWRPVEILNGPGGTLKGITSAAPPIRKFKVFEPVSKHEVKKGTTIYDLGQQASFISTFTASGPAGSAIRITPSELLNTDGTLFRNNYNSRSYSMFILAGSGKETYTSKFFTTGCRYYQVECIPASGSTELPVLESIAGIFVHSDNAFAGEFSSSNELFNKTFSMIRWAELSNMKSVISDCPHRERLGWLEQVHLHGPSFGYNYDMRPLRGKIISDMRDTQQPNGLVPCIAPELTTFGPDWREAIEWGSSAVLLPWQQYQATGNLQILKENYPMMKRYVEFLAGKVKDGIAAPGKGDWEGRRTSPNTPKELVSTAFYYEDTKILATAAKLIRMEKEAALQQEKAAKIHTAFTKAFYRPDTKQYATGSQCANAMALVMGLVEPLDRQSVLNNLVHDIENKNYENTTGEVGWRYVLRALADGGRSDIIFRMNNQDEKPGYGYQLKMGATALPETWDAYRDNSQNQFMLGHIIEWFYHDLAGIQPDLTAPGFKKIIIRPAFTAGISEVKANYTSGNGKITSEWKRTKKQVSLHLVVPPNVAAEVYLPTKIGSIPREGGKPLNQLKEIKVKHSKPEELIMSLGSGEYRFSFLLP